MKPLTYYLSYRISSQLEQEVSSLEPTDKITSGKEFIDMASNGQSFADTPATEQLRLFNGKQLMQLGAALIIIGVDELLSAQ